MSNIPNIYTTQEVAEILKCSTHQVSYFRQFGLIQGIRFGKYWLYPQDEIANFIIKSIGKDYRSLREMTIDGVKAKYMN